MRLFKNFILFVIFSAFFVLQIKAEQVAVKIVSDEAKAVLAVLEKRKTNQTINDADWQIIFQSEDYIKPLKNIMLKIREILLYGHPIW